MSLSFFGDGANCWLTTPLLQGLFEFGISSIYTPSGEVSLFSSKKSEGSTISFTVPLLPTHRIQCLNVCCTYGRTRNDNLATKRYLAKLVVQLNKWRCCVSVKIENKTKDLTWIYRPKYLAVWYYSDLEWLSRWRLGNQLEAGDEINITFDGEGKYEVKECGFKIVYHSAQEEEEENGGTTTIEKSHHDFPEFKLRTGEYFLYRLFKQFPYEDSWFSKHCQQLH